MGITKNIQSEAAICQMALAAFPQKRMDSCVELKEGICNAAYLVRFSDGSKSFRRHIRKPEFLKGYGQKNFSKEEMRRICWYDVLLYLTMMTEGAYRVYPDDGQYQWTKPLFEDSWKELL